MTSSQQSGSLFEHGQQQYTRETAPLAERMRPATFDEFVGQEHILGEDKVLRRSIANDRIPYCSGGRREPARPRWRG